MGMCKVLKAKKSVEEMKIYNSFYVSGVKGAQVR